MLLDDLLRKLPRVNMRAATETPTVTLTKEMAGALGVQHRKLVSVLRPVVNAIAAKLMVETAQPLDPSIHTDFDAIQRQLFHLTVRDGTAYILVTTEAPYFHVVESFDGVTGAAYLYDETGDVAAGLHVRPVADGRREVDLYTDEGFETYGLEKDVWILLRKETLTGRDGSPLGIALVQCSIGTSDIVDAVQLQDDLNSALLDLLAVSRTMGFPMRYTTGKTTVQNHYGQDLVDPITGRTVLRATSLAPGAVQHFAEGTQVNQLPSSTADTATMQALLQMLTLVTTVPLYAITGSDFPSGVALLNAEMRLNHKIESHQLSLTSSIMQALELAVRMYDTYTAPTVIQPVVISWASPQVYTLDLQLEIKKDVIDRTVKARVAGIMSLYTAVKELHPEWADVEVNAEVTRIQLDEATL